MTQCVPCVAKNEGPFKRHTPDIETHALISILRQWYLA
jgi:hypothetical protein